MPRLKPSRTEEGRRIVRAYIACNQERYNISNESLAKALGMSIQTLSQRKKNLGRFTLEELQRLASALKLTPIEAASMILCRDMTAKEIKDFILL